VDFNNFYIADNGNECPSQVISYLLIRSTPLSGPNNITGGNVRLSVGTSVRMSVHKKFFRFQ